MPNLMQVRAYKRARDRVAAPARAEFDRLARAVDLNAPDAEARLRRIANAIMSTYGRAAAELGAQWFEICAGNTDTVIPITIEASETALASNVGYNYARYAAGEIGREVAITYMSEKARECVITAAEETIFNGLGESVRQGNAAKSERYIRVASPDACAFCQMVASNEYTFGDASRAGFESHDGCRCVGVPFSGLDDVGGYDATPYREKYETARDTVDAKDYDKELQARIDAAKAHHAEKTDKPWDSTNETLIVMRYQDGLK